MCFHNSFSFSLLEIFFISLRVFLFISFIILNFVLYEKSSTLVHRPNLYVLKLKTLLKGVIASSPFI